MYGYLIEADGHKPCASVLPRITARAVRRHPGDEPRSHQRLSDRAHAKTGTFSKNRVYTMRSSLEHHWTLRCLFSGNDSSLAVEPKTRRIALLLHTHTPHARRSPAAFNHVDAGEWKRVEKTAAWGCTAWKRVFTHLLSRQQIHSADGDELGDVCTATIFPGRVTVNAATGGGFPVVGGR